jgi:hypothetical protein
MCQVIHVYVAHTMLHMLTSVQITYVDTFVMMWHPRHRPLCCHGSQCSDIDLKKNDTDPNVGRYG